MNKSIISLGALALCITASLSADSNKTFITPEQPAHFECHKLSHHSHGKHALTYKYRHFESTNGSSMGKYFGFNKKASVNVADFITGPDFASQYLVFDPADYIGGTVVPLRGAITLSPEREVNELSLGYKYHAELFSVPMVFTVQLPCARVKHDVRARVSNETQQTIGARSVGLLDFFHGNVAQTVAIQIQQPLTAALWGKQVYSGIKSLDLGAHIQALKLDSLKLVVDLSLGIPTERTPNGQYLFEPVLNNGGQWDLGAGLHATWKAFQNDMFAFELQPAAHAHYRISNDQVRTVGLNIVNRSNWAWYQPMGKIGQAGVFPAANVLTRSVSVHAGWKIDASLVASFDFDWWNINAGYGINWKDSERVCVKSWDDNLYALAALNYESTANFSVGSASTPVITRSMLDASVAASPSMLVHSFMLSVGMQHELEAAVVHAHCGAGYDLVSGQSRGVDGWSINAGLGFHF